MNTALAIARDSTEHGTSDQSLPPPRPSRARPRLYLAACRKDDGTVVTYDQNGNRTRETDANGNTTAKTYDPLNRLTQVDQPETRTLKFEYDLVGNKVKEIDGNSNVTGFHYDVLNRLTTVTDPFNKTVVYTYDAVGNKKTEADKRGNITQFDYNDLNRLTQATDALNQVATFAYDPLGNKLAETDKRGTRTEFAYDNENRLIRTVKDSVTLSESEYDQVGNRAFLRDANGNIIAYKYDLANRMILESKLLAAITNYKYNPIGDRIETRDPEGRITTATFDARRRMLTETNALGETVAHTYDDNGNRLSLKRPKSTTYSYTYDGLNRLTQITDPLGGTTHYTYDKNNNRLTQQDANGNVTRYEYDVLNRQTAMVYADSARTETRYDENGNRVGLTDASGQVYAYIFDPLNREIDKNYPVSATPTGDDIQKIATVYDPNSNPTSITETYSGVTGNRITSKTYDVFDRLLSVRDGFGKTLRYAYDANGNRTTLTDPDGNVTHYTYDALNRLASVSNSSGVTNYEYDRSSLQTKVAYPNGSRAITTYDGAGRTVRIDNTQNTALLSRYEYTYDANGNRTQQIETNGGSPETTAYGFDNNDWLIEAHYPNKLSTIIYDGNGNRLSEKTVVGTATEGNKAYTYNNRNQLTQITDSVSSANNVAYTYDQNGNQTIKTKNGVTTTFVYDVRDQLISVQENTTTLGQFFYDYAGMRIAKSGQDGFIKYVYDGNSVLVQTNSQGVTLAKYEYGPDRLLSINHATEGRQFYLFDALRSTVNLVKTDGSISARYQYDAWGHLLNTVSSWNKFTYTGHEQDKETGLYYFKARFYDPDTGRFLTQDPYLGDVNTPPSLHRYLYAYANPVVYMDLEGYASVCYTDRVGGCDEPMTEEQQKKYEQDRNDERQRLLNAPKRDPFEVAEEQRKQQEETDKAKRDQDRSTIVETDKGGVTDEQDIESIQRERTKAGRAAGKFAEGAGKGADIVGEEVTDPWNYVPFGAVLKGVRGAKIIKKVIGESAEGAADAGKVAKFGKSNKAEEALENSPKKAIVSDSGLNLARKELPPLSKMEVATFDEVPRARTFKKGEKIYRSPSSSAEEQGDPSRWFGTRKTLTEAGTESQYKVNKYGKREVIRTYEVTEDVTLYYGKVAGGKGYQALFPKDVRPSQVLKFKEEVPLK